MANPPASPAPEGVVRSHSFGKVRLAVLLSLFAVLALCSLFLWTTRDAMVHLRFLQDKQANGGLSSGKKSLVDLGPWQTAQALAALAVSAEEKEYARDAERLADHEVDQAFAVALRLAQLQEQNRTLTGDALALKQKVANLQQLIKQDQGSVDRLTAASARSAKGGEENDDLTAAKAQLELDTDELADAQHDLDRAAGDTSSQIQAELAAHEAAMHELSSQSNNDAQVAILSAQQHRTLATRLASWFSQRSRRRLLQQAIQQAQADLAALTAAHNALEAKTDASNTAQPNDQADRAAWLARIKEKSANRQILSIYDDRIQTEEQLAGVYAKWSAQVRLQHRIVFHLILQSLMLIVGITICMVLLDWLVRRLMSHPSLLDRRQMQTLRSILEFGVQGVGVASILVIIFGFPQQTPTILGLATAALTIALQDFILAFFGWFVLMGRGGIHVGDLVEINGVSGEVIEVGLFRTDLLETGGLADHGHPTGRRISFINSYAIRGNFFNFSTAGQWMWDEISVKLSPADNVHEATERIEKIVAEETSENARMAEQDWMRASHGGKRSLFRVPSVLSLRPSSNGIEIAVRYVTRAPERFELRNRLNHRFIDLLHEQTGGVSNEQKSGADPVAG